ncbi:MAG: cytochrome C [Alphaproteobacteria bacterium]|nr:cytochrome C [Alphaproteobacteria bacterium]
MTQFSRRRFIASAAGASAAFGLPAIAYGQGAARVVVIGGGFGGATAARYLKIASPQLQVTLVEPSRRFVTCPYSNLVIGGWRKIDSITFGYDKLTRAGITVVHDTAAAIEHDKKRVRLAGGRMLSYDRLIVSPGIDIRWNAIAGYDETGAQAMPHAWRAGEQTLVLRRQLESMPDGGLFVMAAPANPFRCPPGPYERVSMIASYLKQSKPRSKILILDAKENFSKQPLFQDGWQKFYAGMVEWVPSGKDGKVVKVDAKARTLETEFGQVHKAAVANVIPPQMAGRIARESGLADASGWCPIDAMTFESKLVKGVHVVGDATIAAPMPKSGFAANSQGKVAAAAAVAMLQGRTSPAPSMVNTCYSHVAKDYAISVAGVYRGTPDRGLIEVADSGGVSPRQWEDENRRLESVYADGWYASITGEMFG